MLALLSVKELFLLSGTGCLLVKLGLPGVVCLLSEYFTGDVTDPFWVATVMQVFSTNPRCAGSFFFSRSWRSGCILNRIMTSNMFSFVMGIW